MYGTVARMKLKPGGAEKMRTLNEAYKDLAIPGYVGTTVYQMDADADEVFLVVAFDSKESYTANANDPAQNERFQEMMAVLAAEPEWHDGEIIYSGP